MPDEVSTLDFRESLLCWWRDCGMLNGQEGRQSTGGWEDREGKYQLKKEEQGGEDGEGGEKVKK